MLLSSTPTGIASASTVPNAANRFVRSVAAQKLRKKSVDAARQSTTTSDGSYFRFVDELHLRDTRPGRTLANLGGWGGLQHRRSNLTDIRGNLRLI